MLWPLSVVLVANTNGRLAIPALAGLLVKTFMMRGSQGFVGQSLPNVAQV